MTPEILMHVLPDGQRCHQAWDFEDDPPSWFPIDAADRAVEPVRRALEERLRTLRRVETLDVNRRISVGALCMQDVGIALPDENGALLVLLGRMLNETRRLERYGVMKALESMKIEYVTAPDDLTFEGGDCIFIGRTLFIRRGGRTTPEAVDWVRGYAAQRGYEVVPVEMVDGDFPHLTSMATYGGRDGDGRDFIVRNPEALPDIRAFIERGIRIVDVEHADPRERWAANVLPIEDRLFIQDGCPILRERLESIGAARLDPLEWAPMLPGKIGPTCTCLILDPTRQLQCTH